MKTHRHKTHARQDRLALVAASLLLVGLGACRTSGTNVYTFTEGAGEVGEDIGNRSFDRRVTIDNPRSQRREGSLLFEFDLVNQKSSSVDLEYRVDWFDATGFQIALTTDTVWRPVMIGPEGVHTLSLFAPKPSAVRARVQVRPPTGAD